MPTSTDWIVPDWSTHLHVKALATTRLGGVSVRLYGLAGGSPGGLNLGQHVGNASEAVDQNRRILRVALPTDLTWMEQVYGIDMADLDQFVDTSAPVAADVAVAS